MIESWTRNVQSVRWSTKKRQNSWFIEKLNFTKQIPGRASQQLNRLSILKNKNILIICRISNYSGQRDGWYRLTQSSQTNRVQSCFRLSLFLSRWS